MQIRLFTGFYGHSLFCWLFSYQELRRIREWRSEFKKGDFTMSFQVVIAAMLSICFGFLLGITPGLNEHLHWNLWYIIPISGLLFGCLCGGFQFWTCYRFDQRITKLIAVYLTLATLVGYGAVDYGIYRSLRIEVSGNENIPDGEYKLKDLISFWQYMKVNLGSSTTKTDYGTEKEYGAMGTTISYIGDLVGADLGSLAVFWICMAKYPYCVPCGKYKKRLRQYTIQFIYTEELLRQILDRFEEFKTGGTVSDMTACCEQLSGQHQDSKGTVRIRIDHRACPSCGEHTMLGVVERRSGSDWIEDKKLNFTCLFKNSQSP